MPASSSGPDTGQLTTRASAQRLLALAGVAVPLLYFGNLILSGLLYPGYSHVRQYASELGSSAARWPQVFNTGVVLVGLASVAAGFGFFLALRALTGAKVLPALVALCLALFGAGIIMGGLFPMPDPRHGGFGLAFAIQLAPILLAAAMWKYRALRRLNVYLLGTAAAMLVLLAIMMGVGSLVTRANVGVYQRLYALCMIPWIGVAAWVLSRELSAPPRHS